MRQIGVNAAPLSLPERPRVPPAPHWSWLAGCRRKLWSERLRSKITVVNVAVLGSLRSIRIGTSRHVAGRGGRATEASTYSSSPWMMLPTYQPQNTQVVTQNEESESIWTHLGGARTMPIQWEPMRCAPRHGSSSFLRIGAIHGVPDASRELSFDPCHWRLHRVTLN